MKPSVVAVAVFLASSASWAKPITVTLSDAEQNALVQLIDLALKNSGMQALNSATAILARVQAAASAVEAAPAPVSAAPPTK